MEPITIAAIAGAVAWGLKRVGQGLLSNATPDLLVEPVRLKLQRFLHKAEADKALRKAVQTTLAEAGAPTDDEDDLQRWLKTVSLDRLTAKKNDALRRQVARSILTATDPTAAPPEELVIALGWPRSQLDQLSQLLVALRAQLYSLEAWRPLVEYADEAIKRGQLAGILSHLARLDNVFVETEAGEALRVVIKQQGLSQAEASTIETLYRDDLVRDLKMHDFRGIVQMRQDIRLPLADIYLELGLLSVGGDEAERRQAREQLLAMRETERLAEEERALRQNRVTDALARAQKLVILGEPGAGKTISLRFIALMLAYGSGGATRLGLEAPYIPLMVRLADFAQALKKTPALSLDKFLLQLVEQAHTIPRLGEVMRLALEKGACMVLLDGLDEVGDDPVRGRSLRQQVLKGVQQFADRWCSDPEERPNRLVVTSRLEGYWDDSLHGLEYVQLSPLQPPDEIEAFLLRWYTAHEQAHDPELAPAEAHTRAGQRLADLLPCVLEWPSVRRLATNPLLLTILALIHENVGKLPNRRIRLYEISAQTLIESWRQAQTGLPSESLADLGEETVIRVMAPLAYWLHEHHPGGTASFREWQTRLVDILAEEGFEAEATEIGRRFLHHARYEAGLLAERGLGQFGFSHLTFEEYLAAREMARQRAEERRGMLKAHWEDPRWHEVILLAAGQLGIVEARRDDASDFIEDLLKVEPVDPANAGRQVVLAGRALADIGPRSVSPRTRRWVLDALRETMQDLDPDSQQPHDPPQTPVRTRYEVGEALDELGWLPPDLNAWLRCPDCADDGGDLLVMKYPVTNAQFEQFVVAGEYENPAYWGGKESEGWHYRERFEWSAPRWWNDTRFGQQRRGYPVVGVSWYEAVAYAAWLTELLRQASGDQIGLPPGNRVLVADLLEMSATNVRLPSETEWEKMAGGAAYTDRYPWDRLASSATRKEAAIRARANTEEADLNGTSPVTMYPLGISQPFSLMDLGGNVWEWTTTPSDPVYILRGGAWDWNKERAQVRGRDWYSFSRSPYGSFPYDRYNFVGFRLVSPIVSGF